MNLQALVFHVPGALMIVLGIVLRAGAGVSRRLRPTPTPKRSSGNARRAEHHVLVAFGSSCRRSSRLPSAGRRRSFTYRSSRRFRTCSAPRQPLVIRLRSC